MGKAIFSVSGPTKIVSSALVCLSLAALSGLFLLRQETSQLKGRAEPTAIVARKNFTRALRIAGTTQAARSFLVLAPKLEGAQLNSMVITKLLAAGSHVHQGDVLVEFDPQGQTKDYLDKESTYKDLVSQAAQKRGDEAIARAKDDTALQQAEDELKRTQLELQKNEIVSRIDAEKNREALDEAQATLKQLQETYRLKRQAAQAAIRILEIQRDRAKAAMEYAQSNAQKMVIRSPMAGVVVLNTIWLGGRMGTVQAGDEVRPGVPFLQVVDPSRMQVRAEVNEADMLDLHAGQHAQMHLDAYPGMTLAATLEELAPMGHTGRFSSQVRNFTAQFSIQGTDPRLLPDLSAALDVELESETNALVVPRESVGGEPGHEIVWVKNSTGYEKKPIRVSARNDTEVAVKSGLAPGEVVRFNAMTVQGTVTQR